MPDDWTSFPTGDFCLWATTSNGFMSKFLGAVAGEEDSHKLKKIENSKGGRKKTNHLTNAHISHDCFPICLFRLILNQFSQLLIYYCEKIHKNTKQLGFCINWFIIESWRLVLWVPESGIKVVKYYSKVFVFVLYNIYLISYSVEKYCHSMEEDIWI